MSKLGVLNKVKLDATGLSVDGKMILECEAESGFGSFAKSIYKKYTTSYSKYFKMDNLSKLGFLASEVLLSGINMDSYRPEDVALIFTNTHSSVDIDCKYVESMDTVPSPALFVYTLPNIMMGEISIRHELRGENILYIATHLDSDLMYNTVKESFTSYGTKLCIAGYIDYRDTNNFIADIILVGECDDEIEEFRTNSFQTV